MATLIIPELTPDQIARAENFINPSWREVHVDALAEPVQKLALLGLTVFTHASAGKLPNLAYKQPLLQPQEPGDVTVSPPHTTVSYFGELIRQRDRKVRNSWHGGLATLAFAMGASAVITHPEAEVRGDAYKGEARLVVPGANRAAMAEQLGVHGEEFVVQGGLPAFAGVRWQNYSGYLATVSVSVRQEAGRPHITGDLAGVHLGNDSFETIGLLAQSFNTLGDFPAERGHLGPAELRHLSNALLVGTQVVPLAAG